MKNTKLSDFTFKFIIAFLDTTLHKGGNSNIHTTLHCKPTYEQAYSHVKSENLRSIKDPHNHALTLKTICSTTTE